MDEKTLAQWVDEYMRLLEDKNADIVQFANYLLLRLKSDGYDRGYAKGLEDMHKAVKLIEGDMSIDELEESFPLINGMPESMHSLYWVLKQYDADQILERVKEHPAWA